MAASDYQALIQNARHQAIRSNRPVVVDLDTVNGVVTINVSAQSTNVDCSGSTSVAGRLDLAEYRGVSLSTDLPSSKMLWLPNGRPQRCSGGLVSSTTTFSGSGRLFDVLVSTGGQVQVEAQ